MSARGEVGTHRYKIVFGGPTDVDRAALYVASSRLLVKWFLV